MAEPEQAPELVDLPLDAAPLAVVARTPGGEVCIWHASGVQVVRMGNSWLVSSERADPAPAARAAGAVLEGQRGQPFTDGELFDDGTGWGDSGPDYGGSAP
jgi:hypothetical protein